MALKTTTTAQIWVEQGWIFRRDQYTYIPQIFPAKFFWSRLDARNHCLKMKPNVNLQGYPSMPCSPECLPWSPGVRTCQLSRDEWLAFFLVTWKTQLSNHLYHEKSFISLFSSPRAIGICWEVNAGRWMAGNCGWTQYVSHPPVSLKVDQAVLLSWHFRLIEGLMPLLQ